jgi:hypothetical protein
MALCVRNVCSDLAPQRAVADRLQLRSFCPVQPRPLVARPSRGGRQTQKARRRLGVDSCQPARPLPQWPTCRCYRRSVAGQDHWRGIWHGNRLTIFQPASCYFVKRKTTLAPGATQQIHNDGYRHKIGDPRIAGRSSHLVALQLWHLLSRLSSHRLQSRRSLDGRTGGGLEVDFASGKDL